MVYGVSEERLAKFRISYSYDSRGVPIRVGTKVVFGNSGRDPYVDTGEVLDIVRGPFFLSCGKIYEPHGNNPTSIAFVKIRPDNLRGAGSAARQIVWRPCQTVISLIGEDLPGAKEALSGFKTA